MMESTEMFVQKFREMHRDAICHMPVPYLFTMQVDLVIMDGPYCDPWFIVLFNQESFVDLLQTLKYILITSIAVVPSSLSRSNLPRMMTGRAQFSPKSWQESRNYQRE